MYYAAYGNNLSERTMSIVCPHSTKIGTGLLKGYALHFKGEPGNAYATVEKCDGCEVPVVVWEIASSDLRKLDDAEWYPTLYGREKVDVTINDNIITVFMYAMNPFRSIHIPNRRYYDGIMQSYNSYGFDVKGLIAAYNEALTNKPMVYSDKSLQGKALLDAIGLSTDDKLNKLVTNVKVGDVVYVAMDIPNSIHRQPHTAEVLCMVDGTVTVRVVDHPSRSVLVLDIYDRRICHTRDECHEICLNALGM